MKDHEARKMINVICRKLGAEKVEWASFRHSPISWIHDAWKFKYGNEAYSRTYMLENKINLLAEKLGYEFKASEGMTCVKKEAGVKKGGAR